jgi:hypothetical protein
MQHQETHDTVSIHLSTTQLVAMQQAKQKKRESNSIIIITFYLFIYSIISSFIHSLSFSSYHTISDSSTFSRTKFSLLVVGEEDLIAALLNNPGLLGLSSNGLRVPVKKPLPPTI